VKSHANDPTDQTALKSPVLSDLGFVLLLGAMSMIGPFAIDTLFPAFPVASTALRAPLVDMQLTISAYLFAFALGSLIHGPLSDSFGRRPILLICMSGFVLASFACCFAASLPQLLVSRAAQGFCAAAGTVISRALVRDRCDGPRAQLITSRITLVFLFGPAIAPVIGGLILTVAHWRMIFGFIFIYAAVVTTALFWRLAESHPAAARIAFSPASLLESYQRIVGNRTALLLIAIAAFNFSGLFIMIASAPAICFELWQLTAQDMWKLFIFPMAGILLGSQLSGRTAGRWSHRYTVNVGYALMMLGVGVHLSYGLALHNGLLARAEWWVGGFPILIYGAGSSLAYPSLTMLLMDLYPDRRGAAASVQTFFSLTSNGIVAAVVSPWAARSTLGLAIAQGTLAAAGLLCWWIYRRGSAR
jgi:MFS transporter, DHA1 family, multidrug resistance protein